MTLFVQGTITTPHSRPDCVAASVTPDNLSGIRTGVSGQTVQTEINGLRLRSIIASVDDYLMNLAIAEEICSCVLRHTHTSTGQDDFSGN